MEDDLKWKTTNNRKIWIYLQPLVRFPPKFKLRLIWPNTTFLMFKILEMKMTLNERWPQKEKLMWPNQTINNVSDQGNLQWKDGRRPQILKMKYLSNHCSDLPQNLDLTLLDPGGGGLEEPPHEHNRLFSANLSKKWDVY